MCHYLSFLILEAKPSLDPKSTENAIYGAKPRQLKTFSLRNKRFSGPDRAFTISKEVLISAPKP
jgi:hypothetical protein